VSSTTTCSNTFLITSRLYLLYKKIIQLQDLIGKKPYILYNTCYAIYMNLHVLKLKIDKSKCYGKMSFLLALITQLQHIKLKHRHSLVLSSFPDALGVEEKSVHMNKSISFNSVLWIRTHFFRIRIRIHKLVFSDSDSDTDSDS
jgi:hypothetical protein